MLIRINLRMGGVIRLVVIFSWLDLNKFLVSEVYDVYWDVKALCCADG